MFQLLKNPDFDFMKRGRLFLTVSIVLMLVALGVLIVRGLNLGIEFTGGTELQFKFHETPDLGAIRSSLKDAGLTAQVTTIGEPEENEIYIRLAQDEGDGQSADLTGIVAQTLRGEAAAADLDINIVGQDTLALALSRAPGLTEAQANALAESIADRRRDVAIYGSLDELSDVPGMTPGVLDYLRQEAQVGPVAVRSQSYIGPAVGEELMDKAKLAIVLSLVMMLLYIWIRFQLQWGFAAVVALTHDTLITLGLFSLFGKEMSLAVVAAFLTLVGYSVNDTVVIFDRIRENVRNRTSDDFAATINRSINQTLGRTIITSGLTWIVVFGLYLYGGPALNAFAFVLSVGVIVGTYSSIYIASPLLMLWQRFAAERASAPAPVTGARGTKKVRTQT